MFNSRNAGARMLIASGIVNDGNGGNNYTYTFVPAAGTITPLAITVTAASDTKTYDGTTASADVPTITSGSLVGTDTPDFTEVFDSRNAGARTLTASGVVNDGNGGNNYTYTFVTASGTITPLAITVTAATDTKTYDGTVNSAAVPLVAPGLGAGDTPDFTEVFDSRNVGARTLTASGIVNDGNGGNNYTYTFATGSGTITARAITVTAASDAKTYDGTTTSAGIPTITSGSLATGDTTTNFTQVFDSRNAGRRTLIASGVVNDGNSGQNYSYTFVSAAGTIIPLSITVSAVSDTKTYDGTNTSAGAPTITSGSLATGDTTTDFTQVFDSRNAGARMLIASGVVNDGNGGHNYSYTFVPAAGTITPLAITVTAATETKTYDGTTASADVPTVTSGSLVGTDTPDFTQLFDSPNVGTRTLTASGVVNDGNGGNNYTYTFVTSVGTINQSDISVAANTGQTKTYGTADHTLTYHLTSGQLFAEDQLSGSLSRAPGENVGGYAILQGTLTAGPNYLLSFTSAPFMITPRAITVTAVPDPKVYDGTTSASAVPSITSGSLAAGDVANFTESFATKNVGTEEILIPAGAVSDGNGGNNYAVRFVDNSAGVITARAITVTANPSSRVYDGTTSSSTVPSITAGSLAAGDAANFTERFNTKNVGTGLTLTPAGSVNDGNGGDNYNVTFVANTAGVIAAREITVTAVPASKTYDGGTGSPAVPAITLGSLVAGDMANFTESFTSANAGSGLTLIPKGSVNDGNGGKNYAVTFLSSDAGVITPRVVIVTADAKTKVIGQPDPAFTYHITSGSLVPGDGFSGSLARVSGQAAGTYPILKGTLALDNNYTLKYVGANLTIVPLVVTRTTILASSAPSSVYGQRVSFTAHVVLASGGGVPTGNVEFLDGSKVLGTSALSNGLAVFSTSTLTVGSDPITAIYQGHGLWAPSQSRVFNQKVQRASTTTRLLVGLPTQGPGIVLDADVTANYPSAALPTGSVVFTVNGRRLRTVGLVNGQATLQVPNQTVLGKLVAVDYVSNANSFNSSVSKGVYVTSRLVQTRP